MISPIFDGRNCGIGRKSKIAKFFIEKQGKRKYNANKIFYNTLDTSGGQSGSAIHTTGFTAVGVHTNGYTNENAGVMFNKVYYDWIWQYI